MSFLETGNQQNWSMSQLIQTVSDPIDWKCLTIVIPIKTDVILTRTNHFSDYASEFTDWTDIS